MLTPMSEPTICPLCKQGMSFYCHEDDGTMRPMCIEACGEHTGGRTDGRCRDCGISHDLDSMQCSRCTRMRYRRDTDTRAGQIAVSFAKSIWGDRCECTEPLPPTVADMNATKAPVNADDHGAHTLKGS